MGNTDRLQIERRMSTYIDTIRVFVRRKLPAALFAAIVNKNPGRVIPDEKFTFKRKKKVTWGWMIWIHQPS